jgi:hypothetical protein
MSGIAARTPALFVEGDVRVSPTYHLEWDVLNKYGQRGLPRHHVASAGRAAELCRLAAEEAQ